MAHYEGLSSCHVVSYIHDCIVGEREAGISQRKNLNQDKMGPEISKGMEETKIGTITTL
jgi:hypothetical protein